MLSITSTKSASLPIPSRIKINSSSANAWITFGKLFLFHVSIQYTFEREKWLETEGDRKIPCCIPVFPCSKFFAHELWREPRETFDAGLLSVLCCGAKSWDWTTVFIKLKVFSTELINQANLFILAKAYIPESRWSIVVVRIEIALINLIDLLFGNWLNHWRFSRLSSK